MLDGDPVHIKEQVLFWRVAIHPKVNPSHAAMTGKFPHLIGVYWGELDPSKIRRGPGTAR